MRRGLILFLVVAGLLVACGSDGDEAGPEAVAASQRTPVATAEAFFAAVVGADGDEACNLMTERFRMDPDGSPFCEDDELAGLPESIRSALDGVPLELADETPEAATVAADLGAGQQGFVYLLMEAGTWKVDALSLDGERDQGGLSTACATAYRTLQTAAMAYVAQFETAPETQQQLLDEGLLAEPMDEYDVAPGGEFVAGTCPLPDDVSPTTTAGG